MKRTKLFLLAIITLLAGLVIVFTGCDSNSSTTVKPTYTDEGSCSHIWNDATCTTAKTCDKCGESVGKALGHSWADATCTTAKTCDTCGKSEGQALGHSWAEATCQKPKTCTNCDMTKGNVGDHTNDGKGKCTFCNEDLLLLELQENLEIRLIISTVGGMNAYATIKYENNTNYALCLSSIVFANGKGLQNFDYSNYNLVSGQTKSITYYRAVSSHDRYNSKYYDMYLDNNSFAELQFKINDTWIYVRCGVNGVAAYGYSKDDIY